MAKVPDIKEILKAGLQFGHPASSWNPKMAKFIFGVKNNIHVIDVVQTKAALETAADQIEKLAAEGEVIFIGSKRQAAPIVQAEAIRAGAHFVTSRWPGGLFTNFDTINRSLKRLNHLESIFEQGVEGRTKYEVTLLKSEWQRLYRLYAGVKGMTQLPKAVFVIDPRYEKVAVREARKMNIPVFALVDTNGNPDEANYVIPGNDDALKAIELVVKVVADAVLAGNKGNGVKHNLVDYTQTEVEIKKAATSLTEDEVAPIEEGTEASAPEVRIKVKAAQIK